MREFNSLYIVHGDASTDPHLHGIARGLGQLVALPADDDLPDDLCDLVGRLNARDEWDGPGRDNA